MTGLKIVAISDIHFGNIRINPEDLYFRLTKYLYPEIQDAHLLFIAGDLYDQLLTVNHLAHLYATRFISDIFQISARTGLQVRILHGTYSHDRNQLQVLNNLATPDTKYKIVNDISTEIIEIENTILRVGYLPDNLSYKYSSDVIEHLKKTMACANVTFLDLLIGHGTFDHALPKEARLPPCTYTHDSFNGIVNGLIIMGHIHIHSRYKNIYYCGSFDRMAHNEEEDKGFYVFEYQNEWISRFVKNKDATLFITIQPNTTDINRASKEFIDTVNSLFSNRYGYVRVVSPSSEICQILGQLCRNQFKNLIYRSKKVGENENKDLDLSKIELNTYAEIIPTINNLPNLIFNFLKDMDKLEGITEERIRDKVGELITRMKE